MSEQVTAHDVAEAAAQRLAFQAIMTREAEEAYVELWTAEIQVAIDAAVEAEREACACLLEGLAKERGDALCGQGLDSNDLVVECGVIADAIRARGHWTAEDVARAKAGPHEDLSFIDADDHKPPQPKRSG